MIADEIIALYISFTLTFTSTNACTDTIFYFHQHYTLYSVLSYNHKQIHSLTLSSFLSITFHLLQTTLTNFFSYHSHFTHSARKFISGASSTTPQTTVITMRELDRIRNEAAIKSEVQLEQERMETLALTNERERSSNERYKYCNESLLR